MRVVAGLLLAISWASTIAQAQNNVVVIIADDLGIDNVAAYDAHPDPARTPVLDELIARGLRFENAYANPSCSPTRASILTGRYPWHTGLGAAISASAGGVLGLDELTLPEALAPAGYTSSAVGKWHLGDDLQHPMASGFAHHWGTISSLPDTGGLGDSYFTYYKNVDGQATLSTTYATTDTVDDALALVAMMPEPWFLWVSFNAPHVPFHKPPQELHSYDLPESVAGNEPIHAKAMIEAMDTEIGRLIVGLHPEDTTIVFLGDNGPDPRAVSEPSDGNGYKGTVYEGGVRVPLVFYGAGIPPGKVANGLVHVCDLFATVCQLAGVAPPPGTDSVSLLPYVQQPGLASLRQSLYVETFRPNFEAGEPFVADELVRHRRAMRNQRYKLRFQYVPFSAQVDPLERELFDLWADPDEAVNLLDQPLSPHAAAAYTELQVELVKQRPTPWTLLPDTGLAGDHGMPVLTGSGSLVAQTPVTLYLRGAPANDIAYLFVGAGQLNAPFLCGQLVPAPDLLVVLATDAQGTSTLVASAPPGLPTALPITFQAWVEDPSGPCGWASSRALVGTTAP